MRIYREDPKNADVEPYALEQMSKPLYKKLMFEGIKNIIKEMAQLDHESVFILDKNYVPEEVREVIFTAAREWFADVRGYMILPDQSFDPELKIELDGKLCPWYQDTLCASIIRCFNRTGHKSMHYGYTHSLVSILGVINSHLGENFEEIAKRWGMDVLYFDYLGTEFLKVEPLRSLIIEKMAPIMEMIKEKNYDGDKVAEILVPIESLKKVICCYYDRSKEHAKICGIVKCEYNPDDIQEEEA